MSKEKKTYLRIDNLLCPATDCHEHQKGYSILPSADILPDVYCGNCGGRVEAQFLFTSNAKS